MDDEDIDGEDVDLIYRPLLQDDLIEDEMYCDDYNQVKYILFYSGHSHKQNDCLKP